MQHSTTRRPLAVSQGLRHLVARLPKCSGSTPLEPYASCPLPPDWRFSPDGEGTLAAGGVVAGLWPGGLGLCPVPAFPAALCLPPFLPPRPPKPLMRFGCSVELGSTCSRVSS
ncbi:unnamed protein product [Boreogadus saida]